MNSHTYLNGGVHPIVIKKDAKPVVDEGVGGHIAIWPLFGRVNDYKGSDEIASMDEASTKTRQQTYTRRSLRGDGGGCGFAGRVSVAVGHGPAGEVGVSGVGTVRGAHGDDRRADRPRRRGRAGRDLRRLRGGSRRRRRRRRVLGLSGVARRRGRERLRVEADAVGHQVAGSPEGPPAKLPARGRPSGVEVGPRALREARQADRQGSYSGPHFVGSLRSSSPPVILAETLEDPKVPDQVSGGP